MATEPPAGLTEDGTFRGACLGPVTPLAVVVGAFANDMSCSFGWVRVCVLVVWEYVGTGVVEGG